MQTEVLGTNEIQAGWTVQGEMDLARLLILLDGLIRFVGMTPCGKWRVHRYPTAKGSGGVGCQGQRDLVESWVIFSTWPIHGFIRITLASCKPFDPDDVAGYLAKEIGPVLKQGSFEL